MGSSTFLIIPVTSSIFHSFCISFVRGKGMRRGAGMNYNLTSSFRNMVDFSPKMPKPSNILLLTFFGL